LLNDQAKERKLISILVSSDLDEELEEIFRLGVEWGYFQKSAIGSKEGRGKKLQYILNRRLTPYFNLDPSGYAAYLSVTPDALRLACQNSSRFIQQRFDQNDDKQLGFDLSEV
jgi:hypothetical protein